MFFKMLKKAIVFILVVAVLFFGIIGVVALATHQDYVVVMNAVFAWFKGLSKG